MTNRFDTSEEPTVELIIDDLQTRPRRAWPTSREAVAALLLATAIIASMTIGALAAIGAVAVMSR